MGWNPANWAITDALQEYMGNTGTLNPGSVTSVSNLSPSTSGDDPFIEDRLPIGNLTSTLGANTTTSNNTGSTAPSAPAYDPDDLAFLDDQKAGLEGQLGRADTTLGNTLATLLAKYNEEKGLGEKTYNRNVRDLNDKTAISEFGRGRELDKVDTRARSLANGLRQRIGLASGSGSSAYQITAPNAVQQQASEQRGNVLSDYAANFQALDRNKQDTETDFSDLLTSLAAERTNRENRARSDIEIQKGAINSNIGQLEGKRAEIMGGGYKEIRNAMNPWNQRVQQGESLIDSIYSKYAQKYTAKPVQERTTNLRDYMTDNVAVRDQQATGNDYAPYKAPFGEEEEQVGF